MGYIGNEAQTAFTSFDKQTITGTNTAVYTLTHSVANEQEIEVFVNNVRQEGGAGKAFTVSGNQITFTENIASTDTVYVNFAGKAVQTVTHPSDAPLQATTGAFSGAVSGTTGTFSSAVSGTTGTFSGNVSTAGRFKTTNHPFFAVDIDANVTGYNSNNTSGTVVIPWNRSGTNDGNHFQTSGTDIGRFIAPVAGIYFFDACVYSTSHTTHLWLAINNDRMTRGDHANTDQPSRMLSGNWHVKLAANDKVGIHVYLGGATNNTIQSNIFHTWFRGGLLHEI